MNGSKNLMAGVILGLLGRAKESLGNSIHFIKKPLEKHSERARGRVSV